MMTNCLALSEIRIDGGTQPREAIDQATVDEYAEAMGERVRFPPLIVYHDGVHTWLADGFHRYHAARKAEWQSVDVEWRVGTIEMAKLYAAGANGAHGLRRTAGDKRRAIEMVLSTAEGRRWTQTQIAAHCQVTQQYVSKLLAAHNRGDPQEEPRPAEPTKTEQKRARIAAAAAANPSASNSAIARQLGVDRGTVAAVRAKEKGPGALPVAADAPESLSAPATRAGDYSTQAVRAAAESALEAVRVAHAAMTEHDWKLFLEELAALG